MPSSPTIPIGPPGHAPLARVSSSASVTVVPHPRAILGPLLVLGGIVIASAVQTETASYLAQVLKYDKPYFCFFLTHSSFTFVFPIHLAILSLSGGGVKGSRSRAKALLRSLRAVLGDQFQTPPRWRAIARPFLAKMVPLTGLISAPAVCWFVAMALSPAMDITAIYATSAFFAYFFSLLLLGTPLTRLTVLAISVAFVGVVILTLGGDAGGDDTAHNRVLGDIIMVVGAIGLGLYEVVYKMVLPESQGGVHREAETDVETASDADDDDNIVLGHGDTNGVAPESRTLLPKTHSRGGSGGNTSPNSPAMAALAQFGLPTSSASSSASSSRHAHIHGHLSPARSHHHVPSLPPAFHANFLTSSIGFLTFVLFWIPIPFNHWIGIEHFVAPSGGKMFAVLAVVLAGGSIYNAGLMVLIGIWGPTTSSVANLLTIGLVAMIDAFWLGRIPSLLTFVGAGLICTGFGTLLWEGESG